MSSTAVAPVNTSNTSARAGPNDFHQRSRAQTATTDKPVPPVALFTPINPVSNRLLAERWESARYRRHVDRLNAIHAEVNTTCPSSFRAHTQASTSRTTSEHVSSSDSDTVHRYQGRTNPKKLQTAKDRQDEIDHANAILLQKFDAIRLNRHSSGTIVSGSAVLIQGDPSELCRTLGKRQLTRRIKTLNRIDDDNKRMWQRIEARQPHYNTAKWEADRQRELHYLVNVSRFRQRWEDEMVASEAQYQQSSHNDDPLPRINSISIDNTEPTNDTETEKTADEPPSNSNSNNTVALPHIETI